MAHAPGFRDGLAHIPLQDGEEMILKSGPGFGDFSHPTTRLMMEMMAPLVKGQEIFDIGCGSGILSIAAMKLGAKSVSWVDIDPAAMAHTRENASLNHVHSSPLSNPSVVLMNMIASEQEAAWSVHRCHFHTLITSGILTTQKNEYLEFADSQNWHLIEERQSGEWSGFTFKETK